MKILELMEKILEDSRQFNDNRINLVITINGTKHYISNIQDVSIESIKDEKQVSPSFSPVNMNDHCYGCILYDEEEGNCNANPEMMARCISNYYR